MNDAQTRASGRLRAHRMMDRNRSILVRILREERRTLTADEYLPICRFPHHASCPHRPGCPHCLEVDFADPRTDAEIANIIIAGN